MSVFETAIGLLSPAECILCGREGSSLCQLCTDNNIIPRGQRCYNCNALSPASRTCVKCRRIDRPSHVWIATDYNNTAQELIKAYKYNQQRVVAKTISDIMVDELTAQFDTNLLNDHIVVHIPTATSRLRERGFDHALLLAKYVARRLHLDHFNALGRLGQDRQVGAKRDDRISRAQNNYFVKRPNLVAGRNILLVDDVLTTGATIQAATKLLKKADAQKVDALIFAKKL
jgi:ComF family protein